MSPQASPSNRTKVELKLIILGRADAVQLAPSNRTKVELKQAYAAVKMTTVVTSNRTKVELKQEDKALAAFWISGF